MRVRALDATGEWLFGKGQQDYKTGTLAVAQDIQTRCLMFLGDCFFALNSGINWWQYIGGRGEANMLAMNLAISAMILNTNGVVSIVQLSITLSAQRVFSISYDAVTIYGNLSQTIVFNPAEYLTTQQDSIIITQGGQRITI